jgi:hypothetical protein
LLDLADADTPELHERADGQAGDGLREVRLDIDPVLLEESRSEQDDRHDDQHHGDQDKNTDPKIMRLCIHAYTSRRDRLAHWIKNCRTTDVAVVCSSGPAAGDNRLASLSTMMTRSVTVKCRQLANHEGNPGRRR